VNDAIHSYGGIVLHDIINNRFAKKGDPKGRRRPDRRRRRRRRPRRSTSPFALIQEIREWFDGPLLLSGSISTGDAVLAAQAMGADMAISARPSSPRTKRMPPTSTSR
jgi:nitronate monooxygenase